MKSNKNAYILVIFIVVALLVSLIYLFIPKIEVVENRVNYDSDDKPVVVAYNFFNDYTSDLVTSGSYDTSKIGVYKVNYSFKFMNINISKDVDISVQDLIAPVVTLNGGNESDVCPLQVYEEEGYSSIDNVDGDITSNVEVDTSNKDEVVYTSIDSSNNETKVIRSLTYVDSNAPTIELTGGSSVRVYVGNNYEEKGYKASDKCDGDLTDKVKVEGSVDTNTIGTYTLTYSVSDSANNTTTVEREVKVTHKVKGGSYNGNGDGKIYLTFDDGSSSYTSQILDVLDKYNIKATFFVVHVTDATIRAAKEGHSIGLHSATHQYSIYTSVETYFNDLNTIHDEVLSKTGIDSKIIRFPGGSSNTVSKSYCTGIMSQLVELVQEEGYSYFDWNVDCGDGSGIRNTDKLVSNVLNGVSHNKQNVVLLHDMHEATADAVEPIIKALLEEGYEFDVLDENSTMVVHGVNN